jgi:hypothetical protein
MMSIKNKICSLEIAKKLKEIGFNEPTAHCYIHDNGEEYVLMFFGFLFLDSGYLGKVFEEEKNLMKFDINNISNESDVYFNYNQDLRKLIARRYNGKEWMNDERTYNMAIDSHTFYNWTPKEREDKKIELPNYNDGDFDWDVYSDLISAPSYDDIIDLFREKYNITVHIMKGENPTNYYPEIDNISYKYDPNMWFNSYYECREKVILKALELLKNKNNG